MKKTLTIFATFIVLAVFSQVPEKISYQAVIRNASNILVTNQSVGIKISILQGTATGTSVYSETHSVTTNANGLVSLQIGGGTIVSGTFSSIDWANGPYFIKTETDPNGGSSYTITGTSQLLSVPYALYAKTAGSSTPGPQGASGLNTLVNTTTEPAGANCANGGTKIEFGLDVNSNGILESSEINSALTKYVCNGISQNSTQGNSSVNFDYNGNGLYFTPESSSGAWLYFDKRTDEIPITLASGIYSIGLDSSWGNIGASTCWSGSLGIELLILDSSNNSIPLYTSTSLFDVSNKSISVLKSINNATIFQSIGKFNIQNS